MDFVVCTNFLVKPGESASTVSSEILETNLEIDPVCMSFPITRELKAPEVTLLHNVVTLLNPSIDIIIDKQENETKVILTYDASLSESMVYSIRTLIIGISTLYSGPISNAGMDSLLSCGDATRQNGKSVSPEECVDDVNPVSPSKPLNFEEEKEGEYERPLSLKGQRHVFLYKCRFGALKAIIDRYGCWNLRLASRNEKWPCLLVYCAKDRDVWMNAFKKIQKLEKSNFLRKKVSDSVKNVDLQKLEDLTQTYGQKHDSFPLVIRRNVCISLCVQSPSSPENPSVSVCGVESFVEQVYNIFIDYHLIPEEIAESTTATFVPSTQPTAPTTKSSLLLLIIISVFVFRAQLCTHFLQLHACNRVFLSNEHTSPVHSLSVVGLHVPVRIRFGSWQLQHDIQQPLL